MHRLWKHCLIDYLTRNYQTFTYPKNQLTEAQLRWCCHSSLAQLTLYSWTPFNLYCTTGTVRACEYKPQCGHIHNSRVLIPYLAKKKTAWLLLSKCMGEAQEVLDLTDKTHHIQLAGTLFNPSLRYQYFKEHWNVDPLLWELSWQRMLKAGAGGRWEGIGTGPSRHASGCPESRGTLSRPWQGRRGGDNVEVRTREQEQQRQNRRYIFLLFRMHFLPSASLSPLTITDFHSSFSAIGWTLCVLLWNSCLRCVTDFLSSITSYFSVIGSLLCSIFWHCHLNRQLYTRVLLSFVMTTAQCLPLRVQSTSVLNSPLDLASILRSLDADGSLNEDSRIEIPAEKIFPRNGPDIETGFSCTMSQLRSAQYRNQQNVRTSTLHWSQGRRVWRNSLDLD